MKIQKPHGYLCLILQSANNPKGVGITTICTNPLSHYQLKKYLSIMLENE